LITNAPVGRAIMLNPPASPVCPAESCPPPPATAHELRGRYDGNAVLRVRLTEHAGHRQSVRRC
jgi:hypothetical protein